MWRRPSPSPANPGASSRCATRWPARRETSVLRDIPGLARRLEDLYWQMQETAEAGRTPVPDLSNLDLYYEIGADLVHEHAAYRDEVAYRARYGEKWRSWMPIRP